MPAIGNDRGRLAAICGNPEIFRRRDNIGRIVGSRGPLLSQNSRNQPIVLPAVIELGTWRESALPETRFVRCRRRLGSPAAFEIVAPRPLSSLLDIKPGTNSRFAHGIGGAGIPRGNSVIGKQYFVRQAAILFGIAKATKDPKMSAALMDKAADLKSKVDGPGSELDLTPRAPDIEPRS